MKNIFKTLLCTFALLIGSEALASQVPSMEKAEEIATANGFSTVSQRRPKDPFYSSKRTNAKTWKTLEVHPRGNQAKQITITCNQCGVRKFPEALSVSCFEEAQKVATALQVDLPGGVIKAFEAGENPEETWDLKEGAAKSVRLQRTTLKCDPGNGKGLRFDLFY